jgi:hypothetical protein
MRDFMKEEEHLGAISGGGSSSLPLRQQTENFSCTEKIQNSE